MAHQLTVELPDEVYQPLAEKARETGQTVEVTAQSYLAEYLKHSAPGSHLNRWEGAFDSGVADAAARHHEYLGEAMSKELK